MPSALTNRLFLEDPQRWVYRLSGQRDATYIEIDVPGHIPAATLKAAGASFAYAGSALEVFSGGPGAYINNQGALTTRVTYNVGIQEQDQSALIHRGFELFRIWEDQVETLVRGNIQVGADEDAQLLPSSTYAEWTGILGSVGDWRRLAMYLQEPVEGRLKSIDDVIRYLYDGWQSLLLVEGTSLRLICLLDTPPSTTEPVTISVSSDFDLAHDPNEAMEIGIVDYEGYFQLPAGSTDPFPRRVPTLRLNQLEATLEITLQRLREGAHTRRGSMTLPLPLDYAGLQVVRPGQAVIADGVSYWITETTLNFPEEIATLTLYRAGA